MKSFLAYPVKDPINQSNLFGADPTYYQKVLGTNGHPGIDFESPLYTPIYAPCDADAFYAQDQYHGDGLYLRIPNNAAPTAEVILWHMPDKSDTSHWLLPTGQGVVSQVKAGQLIGYTGNSGYPQESNGPHLHFALRFLFGANIVNEDNGFHGCVDPTPYFTGIHAQDVPTIQSIVDKSQQVVSVVAQSALPPNEKQNALQKVETFLQGLLQELIP